MRDYIWKIAQNPKIIFCRSELIFSSDLINKDARLGISTQLRPGTTHLDDNELPISLPQQYLLDVLIENIFCMLSQVRVVVVVWPNSDIRFDRTVLTVRTGQHLRSHLALPPHTNFLPVQRQTKIKEKSINYIIWWLLCLKIKVVFSSLLPLPPPGGGLMSRTGRYK